MTGLIILASLFAIGCLTALISWLIFYIQFLHSPARRWAGQVFDLLSNAEKCIRTENRQLRQLKKERDTEAASLPDQAFQAHLRDVSVSELEAYPGIGPATIDKLRAAGFVNLAKLRKVRIHIHGLGQKRLADIDRAVRDLSAKARSAFEAGACPQAQSLADKLKALSARYERQEARANSRVRAAEAFIDRLGEPAAQARALTFWRWFRSASKESLILSEVMEAPLPDLEAALLAAEHRFAASESAHPPPKPAQAAPAKPLALKRQSASHKESSRHAPPVAVIAESEMPDETHLLLMELTVQFAWGIARADGPLTGTEREWILQHLRKRFSYNRALLNRAEALCAHYENAAIDWKRCLSEINRRFTADHRTALMEFAGRILAVSGKEPARAAPFLQRLAHHLGVPPVALPLPQPLPPSLASPKPAGPTKEECLRLLEISADTPLSADLVRRQCNLLSERLAPEKVASMGPEFVQLAQTKLADLRRAAESLLESMGEKLQTPPPPAPVADLRHNPDLDDVFGGV